MLFAEVSERVGFESMLHTLTYQLKAPVLFFFNGCDYGCQRFSSKHNGQLNNDFVADITIKKHSALINKELRGKRLM